MTADALVQEIGVKYPDVPKLYVCDDANVFTDKSLLDDYLKQKEVKYTEADNPFYKKKVESEAEM